VFSLLCFVDFKAPIHDYSPKVFYTSGNHVLLSQINEQNRSKFLTGFMKRSILMKEKKRETPTVEETKSD
jgi:hypothetical protein